VKHVLGYTRVKIFKSQ